MLDYKDIIVKRYALGISGGEIARQLGVSKSGVNDFLRAFEACEHLSYPLPNGITNYGIAEMVYGKVPEVGGRNGNFRLPDFQDVSDQMLKKNMTLVYQWNRYVRQCQTEDQRFYSYRQFCELYNKWSEENYETIHFTAVSGQKMEVDFAGQAFQIVDKVTGELSTVVVFVAILPYSQYIYAEGMASTKEPQWIAVNNHALTFFKGVPALVVCDNCKQAVIVNKDWIAPELNKDYREWAEHNHTVILPAKVRKPKYKSSVENAVGILEKGIFHTISERKYFSLDQFNRDLWRELEKLNHAPFQKKEHDRSFYWEKEQPDLLSLPSEPYKYMERKVVKVYPDYHIRFDNAYYSVDRAYLHKSITVGATADEIKLFSMEGVLICTWPRASHYGEWLTDPKHLPQQKNFSEWNGTYFTKKAMMVGPKTLEVIKAVLQSKPIEVQTYRLCIGILSFTKKYSKHTLEECCARALQLGKPTYSFIKNSIVSVADEVGPSGFNTKVNEERNQGAFVMAQQAMEIDHLLSKSNTLVNSVRKESK